MLNWPIPKNYQATIAFLGLTGFFRRFIKSYAKINFALKELLKKIRLYGLLNRNLFEALKIAMTEGPVLKVPNFTKQFVIQIDALRYWQGHSANTK